MEHKKIRAIGAVVIGTLWLILAVAAWVKPADSLSETERRPLAQLPSVSVKTLFSGEFAEDFEGYTVDQFPLRESFRTLKAVVNRYVLGQLDNNGVYMAEGYLAKLESLDRASVDRALSRFSQIYESYLKESGCTVFAAVIPDKGYYLAEENGFPAMDYESLFSRVKEGMSWASWVELTDCLSIADYYRTDTHWRQERILPVAQRLSSVMGLTQPELEDYTANQTPQPFHGVYYGQAALPMKPDEMYLLKNDVLENCRVYNHEKGIYTPVYDIDRLTGQDPYEVYLSGPQSLLTVENPNAATDRELIIFRDSFAGALTPLLVQDYAKITLVDIRYLNTAFLDRYVDFQGQDILFLYSTLVLNSGSL